MDDNFSDIIKGDFGAWPASDTKSNTELNRERLNTCERHYFLLAHEDWERGIIPEILFCSKCAGGLPGLSAVEYARGYAAAGKDPNKIIPGFTT